MNNRKKQSHIWLDLTDFLVWEGHFTGIQRVTYEYARRFKEEGARFCAYDKLDNRFIEIDLDFITNSKRSDPGNADPPITKRRKLRQVIGKPYYVLDENKKAVLRPLVGAVNFYVRYGISKVYPADNNIKSPYHDIASAVFDDGDTVILLGAGWNEPIVLERLINIKKVKRLKIAQHINDLLPIYQPQLFSEDLPGKFRPYINKVIHHADTITVISEATKRDVEVYCRENSVTDIRIEVVRLGDDVNAKKPLRPERVARDEKFLLAVGTFEVRKNYLLLYQAVKLAQLEGVELPRIVIAGRKGWLVDDLEHTISVDPYAKEHILHINNASDNEISWLYENCMFSIFPSLAEGWGLPIVESLQHHKMVLASGVSSMLEIGEGLIDFFLPYDARECLEKIRYYLAEDRYEEANRKIATSYKPYTWDQSYQRLRDIIIR